MLDITPATPPVDQQDGGADAGTKMPVATSGCSCDSSGGAASPFGALGLGAAVLALLRRRRV
jgi:MYXO-CTERM domain-containing protein